MKRSTLPLIAPLGLRDSLPEATRAMQQLTRPVLDVFEEAGYGRVTTPAFEYAEVLERGLELDRREIVRFIEADSGEVALLRPDITPQVARIAATRLSERPPPLRLCYQGTVIRRSHGRARRSRMAYHAGVECMGIASVEGDLEVVELAVGALRRAGLQRFRVELGDAAIAGELLSELAPDQQDDARDALSRKDRASLEALDIAAGTKRRLASLTELFGGREVLRNARRRFKGHGERLDRVAVVMDALGAMDVDVGVDLGEPRGHRYYTGLSFTLLADGPGAELGGGGRYDRLLASFGRDLPATGFGLDLDRLYWALRAQGTADQEDGGRLRLLCHGAAAEQARGLRDARTTAVSFDGAERAAIEYARAWRFHGVISGRGVLRVSDGERQAWQGHLTDELRQWLDASEA